MRPSSTGAGGGATLFAFASADGDAAAGPVPFVGPVILPKPPSMNASMSSSTFFNCAGGSLAAARFGALDLCLGGGGGGAPLSTTSVPSSSMSMLEISSSMTMPSPVLASADAASFTN